jgi:hypothetical protein
MGKRGFKGANIMVYDEAGGGNFIFGTAGVVGGPAFGAQWAIIPVA